MNKTGLGLQHPTAISLKLNLKSVELIMVSASSSDLKYGPLRSPRQVLYDENLDSTGAIFAA